MEVSKESARLVANSIRDFATQKGNYSLQVTTVGDYLAALGIYNPDTRLISFDPTTAIGFQRSLLDIRKNTIKQRMLRDLCRGCTLPPLVVYESSNQGQKMAITDGLQRTHVVTEALRTLMAIERNEQPEDYAKSQIAVIKEHGQKVLSVAEFLKRPLVLQVWHDLEPDELVRLFMILNAGQQKVSPRHLLEVIHRDIRSMFEEWGIRLLTEREEKSIPRRRGRKSSNELPIPSITHFRFEFLIDGLIAFVCRDPQIKTRAALEQDVMNQELSERLVEIGSEACESDFKWVCLELNRVINKKYADVPKWRGIIQTSDNFFIPLMAAFGEARSAHRSGNLVEQRKKELWETLDVSKEDDPLRFYTGGNDSLEAILDKVKSNIGRKRRAIIYFAWLSFFRHGIYEKHYPIEWRSAALSL